MRVAVLGLWHLGSVTAASLAAAGHDVVGIDFDPSTIQRLRTGQAPVFEPGLDDTIAAAMRAGRLRFSDQASAAAGAELLWVAYDTPVDAEDRADVEFVHAQVDQVLATLSEGTLVLVSSQMPVGSISRMERRCQTVRPDAHITFGYSPENLRLGKALAVFQHPDRVVAGVRDDRDRQRVTDLLAPFTSKIEWMSVESAEMTKHALNAFLATCVAFANEIATLCEVTGADAKEVERGLKSESRIGPGAYLGPGAAFAGGTLARDIMFLSQLADEKDRPVRLISSVRGSNDAHKQWAASRLQLEFGDVRGRRIAVWGLTYKPDTDTLRRSSAVELCERLHQAGAIVCAHDPAVTQLPPELAAWLTLAPNALDVVRGADALVVATAWPVYRTIDVAEVVALMPNPRVLDASRFLAASLGSDPRVRYITVGQGSR